MRYQINTRFDLAQYCLRKLGAPIIKINVTEDQIDDRIDEALDMFIQYHADGSYRQVYVHKITQEQIDRKEIILPKNVLSVVAVYLANDPSSNSLSSNASDIQVQQYFTDIISQTYNATSSASAGNMATYTISQQYLSNMQSATPNALTRVNVYKVYENKLIISDYKWDKSKVGDIIGLDCFYFEHPDEVGYVYNDYWLKQYTTALIKLQWANNISKFSNIPLPGGGTLNGDTLMQSALQEIADLELKLKNQYSLPIEPFMG